MSFADLPGWRTLALDDVKAWLAETDDVDVVADAVRKLIKILPAGNRRGVRDIDEVMRRAERRLAQLVRAGQATGAICVTRNDGGRSPRDIVDRHVLHYAYVMFDGVSDAQFEAGIVQARRYGTLSRSSMEDVLHHGERPDGRTSMKVSTERRIETLRSLAEQGLTSSEIAERMGGSRQHLRALAIREGILLVDRSRNISKSVRVTQIRNLAETGHRPGQIAQMIGIAEDRVRRIATEAGIDLSQAPQSRRLDANRVLSESTSTLEGVAMAIGLIDTDDLDPERVAGWAASLKDSIRTLQHLHKELTR